MFSQTSEYALRAAVCLAQNAGSGALTTAQIAERTKVPADYLAKILQTLTRSGLVTGRRGLNGGYALARPASQVSILEIVNAVDPIKRITTCPLGLEAHGTRLCKLHRQLDNALAHVEKTFAEATLDKMSEPERGSRALCPTKQD
jgi:Rrf2 family protein